MKNGLLIAALISSIGITSSYANTSTQPQKADAKFVTSNYAKTKYPIVFAHGLT